ncbi:hypothetical protein F2Q69_00035497 [Brassica cretica]|uniref:Uncharacterized protein n=1 Tax=Brassica cretica TaxID=69181 RepID=A0A8S9SFS0_BRACR|nr:hypothetical protein F2Q69_00035497 [Brassica cretica]
MSTTTLFQSRSHRRPPEESKIQESLQHATVEPNTRKNTRCRSKLILQHRSTVPTHTEEYDEDYEEERAIEQIAILDEQDRLLHHFSWKKMSPSIDRNGSTSIETQLHQPNRLRASTDIAYYPSIDTNVDATRDRDYSIGIWADDRHHESYALKIAYRDQRAD